MKRVAFQFFLTPVITLGFVNCSNAATFQTGFKFQVVKHISVILFSILTFGVYSQGYHAYEQSVHLKNVFGKYEQHLNWKKCDKVIKISSEKVIIENNVTGNTENFFVKKKENNTIKKYEENFLLHCQGADDETVKILFSRDGNLVGISVQYDEKLMIYKVNQVSD